MDGMFERGAISGQIVPLLYVFQSSDSLLVRA